MASQGTELSMQSGLGTEAQALHALWGNRFRLATPVSGVWGLGEFMSTTRAAGPKNVLGLVLECFQQTEA